MSKPLTIQSEIHFRRKGSGAPKTLADGPGPLELNLEAGRVPRVARLMALALRFEELIRTGVVADYAALARLGHVTRARMSQIMNLLQLAPDIQEQLLFLPNTERGRDPIHLRQLQPIAGTLDWKRQRRMWAELIDS